MRWTISLKESVIDDLRWFGKKEARLLLREAAEQLAADPLCQEEPIVVAANGVPAFQLAPLDDDNLIDRLIATNPEFRQMLESRVGEAAVPLETALDRL